MMRFGIALVAAALLCAQEPHFAARSRLVLVPVTITDVKGRHVAGLEAADFAVLDNGERQNATVDTFGAATAPIALIVAVQSSGISAAALEKVQKVGGMLQPLITGERGCAGLVSFSDRITWLQECTNNTEALQRAFQKLAPGEYKDARMLDAASSAIEHLLTYPNSRRVLLLISESRDRGSEADLASVAVAAQSTEVAVYAATYSAFRTPFTSRLPVRHPQAPQRPKRPNDTMGTNNGAPPNKWNPKIPPPEQLADLLGGIGELARLDKANTVEILAKSTGGALASFTTQKGLEDAIQKLGAELHAQYLLSFVPQGSTPGYHRLEVRVTYPGEFHVRARLGYWAMEDPGLP